MALVDVQFTIPVQYSYNNATLADPMVLKMVENDRCWGGDNK